MAGFCWGGGQTFRVAIASSKPAASLVFYGTAPADGTGFERIEAPVHGFYGENDQRVNATIEDTRRR